MLLTHAASILGIAFFSSSFSLGLFTQKASFFFFFWFFGVITRTFGEA